MKNKYIKTSILHLCLFCVGFKYFIVRLKISEPHSEKMSDLVAAKIKIDGFCEKRDSLIAALFIAEQIRRLKSHSTTGHINRMQISRIKEKSSEFQLFRSKINGFDEKLLDIENELSCGINLFRHDRKASTLIPIRETEKSGENYYLLTTEKSGSNPFR